MVSGAGTTGQGTQTVAGALGQSLNATVSTGQAQTIDATGTIAQTAVITIGQGSQTIDATNVSIDGSATTGQGGQTVDARQQSGAQQSDGGGYAFRQKSQKRQPTTPLATAITGHASTGSGSGQTNGLGLVLIAGKASTGNSGGITDADGDAYDYELDDFLMLLAA